MNQRSDSKQKVHSEESKSYTQNSKNLTELLSSVRQKQESHSQIKKRVFRLEQNEQDSNMSKLKRISETYNIKTNRKDSIRNSKISRNSLSGTKFFPMFSPGKNSDTKFHPYHGIVRSSPKLQSKLTEDLHSHQKINMSEQKLSLQKKKEKRKNEYISLNSSIVGKAAKSKVQSNRIVSEQQTKQLKQIYDEAMDYYRKKNSHKALILFKECLKYDSQNVDCLYYVGSCCLNMQNYQQSVKYLLQAKIINPSYNMNLYLYLAISLKKLKDEDQALKVLQLGVKIFPDFQDGYLYIAKIYMRQSKFNQAIVTLQNCIQLNPYNLIGNIMLADACSLVNQQLRASQILKQVLERGLGNKLDSKTQISTHLKLIKLLLNMENYQDSSLSTSLSFLQHNTPTSPQLAFYKSLIKYETSPQMTSKQLSEMKINLYFALNQLNTYQNAIDCTKLLLKIYIDNKDFYGAEETLKRITHSQVKPEHLKEWTLFIQGANDIIKRKIQQGKQKIIKCIKKLNPKKTKLNPIISQLSPKDATYLKLQTSSFLAYILYLEENLSESLSVYQQILNNSCQRTYRQSNTKTFDLGFKKKYGHIYREIQLNKIVIEAIVDHKVKQNFNEAKKGFQFLIQKRTAPQPIFMWAINQISLLKKAQNDFSNLDSPSQNQQIEGNHNVYSDFEWSNFFNTIVRAEAISPSYSLIYFYHSLALLYLQSNTQALKKVQQAIQKVQEPVSEYHFIEALCHYTIFQQTRDIESAFRGLQAIDKAIQIDAGIPEFYKERSKHFFCLGKYDQSIKDCEKCQEENPDDEIKLLCMFYSYVASKYQKSEALLQELACPEDQNLLSKTENQMKTSKDKIEQNLLVGSSLLSDNEHKYKQFEQALKYRVKKYSETGLIGKLLVGVTDESCPKLDKTYLNMIREAIKERHQYSQFTVYFMNLLIGAYFIQQNDFTTSLNYLFACLQQIQLIVDQKQEKMNYNDNQSEDGSVSHFKARLNDETNHVNTEDLLNEIKYNIVVATLVKNSHEKNARFDCLKRKTNEGLGVMNVEEIYHEALTLIQTFMRQSHCQELVENLQVIKSLILKSQSTDKSSNKPSEKSQNKSTKLFPRQSASIPVYLKPYPEIQKFSDQMPYLIIPIGNKYILMTKFIIFHPVKLRFNIKPQFDPAFLFNFDIDKVENKITPPWFRFSQTQSQGQFQNRIIFTDQLRNQSIAISSTQRGASIIDHHSKSKHRYDKNIGKQSFKKNHLIQQNSDRYDHDKEVDFKQMIKLDSKIQKKLKKLFPK